MTQVDVYREDYFRRHGVNCAWVGKVKLMSRYAGTKIQGRWKIETGDNCRR